ncbi:cyclic nucleotide-binding domain-containing protein [Amphritea balenae]|uniref:Cyclic nucleotide-binding domain-containing protein n=2 Tax=Amphritea balenae TaxID=452629 RepID=A0A3P1SXA4_9GAMM|nr:cyclic nucleotide-binding domain-containing protein [Amphritea balenae]
MTVQQLLKQHDLHSFTDASVFGALPESAINWLLEQGVIREYEKGERLFDRQQPGDSFHIILVGQVGYYKYHDGRYAYIRDFKQGEQIGFVSLIALHDRAGRAEADRATVSLEINSRVYHDFHHQYPLEFGILMMNLAREMARTLRNVNNLLVEKS